tara:strand:+ start:722 stop:1822 length:1101 start_codon:yes stop_codon:yes gene_type:complete
MTNKKFSSLETFRGFAALMIAAIHFDVNSPIVNHNLAHGHFVHFFFTLSGFVIFYNYNDKLYNLSLFKVFVIKRFLRLYPLHLFFLIIFLCIEIFKYYIKIYYDLDANNQAFSKNDLSALVYNVFLIHTFLTEYTFNTPSWSISAEFLTYILFALILMKSSKMIYSILILLIIFLIRVNDDIYFGASHSGYKSLLDCIYGFYFGVIFCKIYFIVGKLSFYQKNKSTFSIIFVIISIISFNFLSKELQILFPLIFGLTILFSCELDNGTLIGKILTFKFFVYLGQISYSIYMSHLFIFWILTQILRFFFRFQTYLEEDTNFVKLDLSLTEANLLVISSYTLTIIFSAILYRYIENNKFYLRSKSKKI